MWSIWQQAAVRPIAISDDPDAVDIIRRHRAPFPVVANHRGDKLSVPLVVARLACLPKVSRPRRGVDRNMPAQEYVGRQARQRNPHTTLAERRQPRAGLGGKTNGM